MRALAMCVLGALAIAGTACNRSEAAPAADPALFEPVASVLIHPRCINCHQAESPRQTDAKILHRPLVVRGADDRGAPTQQCQTCHQATNTANGFVPGVPNWRLAPLSMLWEGRSKAQICEQMKDPARNGGRHTGEQIIEHMLKERGFHFSSLIAIIAFMVLADGRKAAMLPILKSQGSSTLDVVAGVRAAVPKILATLPRSLDARLVFDQSVFVRAAVQGVLKEGAIAAGLTALMMGAMLFIVANGSGPMSLDSWLAKRSARADKPTLFAQAG